MQRYLLNIYIGHGRQAKSPAAFIGHGPKAIVSSPDYRTWPGGQVSCRVYCGDGDDGDDGDGTYLHRDHT